MPSTNSDFVEGTLIPGGDINIALDPLLDTSNKTPHLSYAALRCLRKCLHTHQLTYEWRALHQAEQDYSHYSPPHKKYIRFALILLYQHSLPKILEADIGSILIIDHAPVSILLDRFSTPRSPFQWRLNETSLQDPTTLADIKAELKHYFTLNSTSDINPMVIWKAHKANITGY